FFFQAEDGIRDFHVTGVQTCALPIYPEFRRLMAEFRDGLVLFQFMEDSVWTAAENDSLALLAFYEEHRDTYRWPDRERIIGFLRSEERRVGKERSSACQSLRQNNKK